MRAGAVSVRVWRRWERSRSAMLAVIVLIMASAVFWAALKDRPNLHTLERSHALIADHALADILGSDQSQRAPLPAMVAPPGYGLVLASLAIVDPGTRAMIRCRAHNQGCGHASARATVLLQAFCCLAILALSFGLVFILTERWEAAILGMLVMFFGVRHGDMAALAVPIVFQTLSVVLTLFLCVLAVARRSCGIAVLAGMAQAATIGFLPHLAVLVPVACGAIGLCLWRAGSGPKAVLAAFGFAAGCGAIALAAHLVHGSIVSVEALARAMVFQFSQRLAYQAADFEVVLAGLLVPTPILGDAFAMLFSDAAFHKLGPYYPGTLAMAGVREVYPLALRAADGALGQFWWLASTYSLGDPLGFLKASLILAVRTIWMDGDLVAVFGIVTVISLVRSREKVSRNAQFWTFCILTFGFLLATWLLTPGLLSIYAPGMLLYAYAIGAKAADWPEGVAAAVGPPKDSRLSGAEPTHA